MIFTSSRIVDFLLLVLAAAFLIWDVVTGGLMAADHLILIGMGGAGLFIGYICAAMENAGYLKFLASGFAAMLIAVALGRLIQMASVITSTGSLNVPALLVIAIVAIVTFAAVQLVPGLFKSSDASEDDDDDDDDRKPTSEPTMIHVGRHKVPLNADGYISLR